MLWFYWRRVRLGVLVTGVALGSIAALVLVAGSASPGAERLLPRKTLASRSSPGLLRRAGQARIDRASVRRGIALMQSAVAACRTVSYSGIQMIAWWGSDEANAYVVDVWHRSGEPEIGDDSGDADGDALAGPADQPGTDAAADHAATGVLSLSRWMLSLLRHNYLIEYTGLGSAVGRYARIVAVRQPDGSLVARFWLDVATGLPLRRELYDSSGRLVNEGAFIDLNFGNSAPGPEPSPVAQAWRPLSATSDLPMLRRQGWPVPSTLAGDMSLVGVSRESTNSGDVVDASYSDGLSVVSVFMQHGELPRALPGWSAAQVRGQRVYSSEPDHRSLAWSAGGVVYTVISDAPQDAVDKVIAQLPHDHDIGLWQRVRHGLARIGSWLDPFG
jgi:sigma-E factor negative regulatory protein RseB